MQRAVSVQNGAWTPDAPQQVPPAQAAWPDFADCWDPIVVDIPGPEFEPKPWLGGSARADTEFDGWSSPHITMRMASVRGYRHRYCGKPRQDHAQTTVHPTGVVLFAVADGVSSAEQADLGAMVACDAALRAAFGHLNDGCAMPIWQEAFQFASSKISRRAAGILGVQTPAHEDVERLLATTLVAGAARPRRTSLEISLARVGDSGAWVLDCAQDRFQPIFAPKADDDDPVVPTGVNPLPRIPEHVEQTDHELAPGWALLVGTDGFGDPLGDGTGQVGSLFARHLRTAPPARGLAHLLDFSRETFDDDRTLLALWPLAERTPH